MMSRQSLQRLPQTGAGRGQRRNHRRRGRTSVQSRGHLLELIAGSGEIITRCLQEMPGSFNDRLFDHLQRDRALLDALLSFPGV